LVPLNASDNIGIFELRTNGSSLIVTGHNLSGAMSREGIYHVEVEAYDEAMNRANTTFVIEVYDPFPYGLVRTAIISSVLLLLLVAVSILVWRIRRKNTDGKAMDP
ncbi:MAG: hypothetical protein QCI82_12050, partial [Candidatus Thermoplasmatota archaeon]|nr:hypothetical protein [Candidatus Thermoplasmatota archaeon]